MKARILYMNTHVGQAIFQGGLAWAIKEYEPDLVVVVEVGRSRQRRALRRAFSRKDWSITGMLPVRPLMVDSGTHIVARRSVLKRKSWKNRLLTKQRWENGRRDKWHPLRRLTRAVFVFRENPTVDWEVGADHSWTYAGFDIDGPHEVPTQHRKQIHAFCAAADRAIRRGAAVTDVGDFNERVEDPDVLVRKQMQVVHMKPIILNDLDAIFANYRVIKTAQTVLKKELIHSDHDGFVVDVIVN